MIDFQLRVDGRIMQAILPRLEEAFALLNQQNWNSFPCPNPLDEDFSQAWEDGLKHETSEDRIALARLLKLPRFQHGFVQVSEEEAENVLRGLSELRLTIREKYLDTITDQELENGDLQLEKKNSKVKVGYFSYLVLAEIQEKLISYCI